MSIPHLHIQELDAVFGWRTGTCLGIYNMIINSGSTHNMKHISISIRHQVWTLRPIDHSMTISQQAALEDTALLQWKLWRHWSDSYHQHVLNATADNRPVIQLRPRCGGCGQETEFACPDCRDELREQHISPMPWCQGSHGHRCYACEDRWQHGRSHINTFPHTYRIRYHHKRYLTNVSPEGLPGPSSRMQ